MITKISDRKNLNFQSKLKIISPKEFKTMSKHLNPKKCEVGYPWQPENIKSGKKLFTTNIMDCIAGLVINKSGARMFHLATLSRGTAKKHNLKGFNIDNAKQKILENVDLSDKSTHAFILGGMKLNPEKSKYNWTKLDKIKKFFKSKKIPYTIIGGRKDTHYFGRFSFLYNKKTDTIYITNTVLGNKNTLNSGNEATIFKNGKMEFHTYKKTTDKKGLIHYNRTRHFGTPADFMKSQFNEVQLSSFDSWA